MAEETKPEGLALMRAKFPDHQISLLPKGTLSRDEMKKLPKGKCSVCGGYHPLTNTIHLDYVGHAAITNRLLDADPNWSWEPVAFGPDGLPKLDQNGGLWIRLTVCGVTRLGYGDAPGKLGGDAMKEVIGDALRNAAMRFGAGLELWHKGELFIDEETGDTGGKKEGGNAEQPEGQQPPAEKPTYPQAEFDKNFPAWSKAIAQGKKTHAWVIKMAESVAPLTPRQKEIINAVKVTATQEPQA